MDVALRRKKDDNVAIDQQAGEVETGDIPTRRMRYHAQEARLRGDLRHVDDTARAA